jgi:hypothetical protein
MTGTLPTSRSVGYLGLRCDFPRFNPEPEPEKWTPYGVALVVIAGLFTRSLAKGLAFEIGVSKWFLSRSGEEESLH